MQNMISFYNSEVDRYHASDKSKNVKDFVNNDATKTVSYTHLTLPTTVIV